MNPMSLSIGIVGLPNVGKSTLFNALTKKGVPAENYPFCTIDPSVGIVAVPDARLWKLSEFSQTQKTIPAAIEFVDIAGLVEGASKGEGLGNQFLSHIREVDAILHMVRMFPISGGGTDIAHVYGSVDPIRDITVINLELILADFETVVKRKNNIQKDVKRNDKEALIEDAALQKIHDVLENGKLARTTDLDEKESAKIKQLGLLTMKPMLFSFNKRSGTQTIIDTDPKKFAELISFVTNMGSGYVVVDAKIEDDLKDFEGEVKEMFRKELGAENTDDGINTLIKEAYNLLGLEVYFTTGEKETRAWTIQKGSTAPVAASAIHTDFEKKFIRAEVVSYNDLVEAGSLAEARNRGTLRTEGKEYIVKDGDVIEFKI
jgi:GTP-binding protein YchF